MLSQLFSVQNSQMQQKEQISSIKVSRVNVRWSRPSSFLDILHDQWNPPFPTVKHTGINTAPDEIVCSRLPSLPVVLQNSLDAWHRCHVGWLQTEGAKIYEMLNFFAKKWRYVELNNPLMSASPRTHKKLLGHLSLPWLPVGASKRNKFSVPALCVKHSFCGICVGIKMSGCVSKLFGP